MINHSTLNRSTLTRSPSERNPAPESPGLRDRAAPGGGASATDWGDGFRHSYLPQAETRDMRVDGPAHPELDPDHHLWKNGTRWWIAITLHAPDWTKTRLRRSLGTADIVEARRRRDAILRYFERSTDYELSLRYARQYG